MYQGELHINAALLIIAGTHDLHKLRSATGCDNLHPGKCHGINTEVVCQPPPVFVDGVASVLHIIDLKRGNRVVLFVIALVRGIEQLSQLWIRTDFIERQAPDSVAALRHFFFKIVAQCVLQSRGFADFVLGLKDAALCK